MKRAPQPTAVRRGKQDPPQSAKTGAEPADAKIANEDLPQSDQANETQRIGLCA